MQAAVSRPGTSRRMRARRRTNSAARTDSSEREKRSVFCGLLLGAGTVLEERWGFRAGVNSSPQILLLAVSYKRHTIVASRAQPLPGSSFKTDVLTHRGSAMVMPITAGLLTVFGRRETELQEAFSTEILMNGERNCAARRNHA